MIGSNVSPNICGIEENNEINVIELPEELIGNYRYIDLFKALIELKYIPLGNNVIFLFIILLAIIRASVGLGENVNELPYVLINP